MARDPGSLWSPLAEAGQQGTYTKDKFIVHSTGDRGTAEAIYNYFNRNDIVVESTFVVGLSAADPTRQLLDSTAKADANVAANRAGISVEVVGTGDDEYTDWQIAELIRLGRWAHDTHAIVHQIIPDPDGAGYGWHVMFGAPGPWTSVAKVCPGDKRIETLNTVIFPAIFAEAPKPVVKPKPAPKPAPPTPWYRGELGSRVLRNGSKGSDVTALQAILARRFPAYRHEHGTLVVDGILGGITEAWVREFQKRSGLTVDGVAGRKTFRALDV